METLLGLPANIVVPVFASIVIFLAGLFVNFIVVVFKKHRSRLETKQNIIIFLSGLRETLKQYIINLRELSNNIEKSEKMQPEAFHYVELSLSYFREFHVGQVADALLHGISPKNTDLRTIRINFYMYNVQIDFLMSVKAKIEEAYDEYRAIIHKLMDRWNNIWVEFCQDIYKSQVTDSLSDDERNVYSQIDEILNDLGKKYKGQDVPSSVMVPCLGQFSHILSKSSSPALSHMRLTNVLMSRLYCERLSMNGCCQLFASYANDLDRVYDKLSELLVFYRKCKTRWL